MRSARAPSQEPAKLSLAAGSWARPTIVVLARPILAVAVQCGLALLFELAHVEHAWRAAGRHWTVYGTLIDVTCIVLVAWFVRREGGRFADLVSFDRRRLARDVLLGLLVALLIVMAATAGGALSTVVVGAQPTPIGPLPVAGIVYSVVVWPIVWGFAEQLTYQGYALPRFVDLTKRPWLAIIIVGIPWTLQHAALPLVWDRGFMLSRLISTFPVGLVLMPMFLRTRRLFPFIIGHWLADALGVVMSTVAA
jgi:membrane protease YdiL (CAAX protease family)